MYQKVGIYDSFQQYSSVPENKQNADALRDMDGVVSTLKRKYKHCKESCRLMFNALNLRL